MKNNSKKTSEINKNLKIKTLSHAVDHLRQVGKWSELYPYLIENGYEKKYGERINKNNLLDSETKDICLVLYTHLFSGKEPFTIRSLSKIIASSDENSRIAKSRKIKRLLESVEQYNIIEYYKDTHKGNRECTRIEPTDLLINFIELHFFNKEEN